MENVIYSAGFTISVEPRDDDYNLMTMDRAIELADIRKMVIEHEGIWCNGGALHIVTEDGNTEDENIQYCIDVIESGEWQEETKDSFDASDELMDKQLVLAKALLSLSEFERECVLDGNVICEKTFNKLFNE